MRVCALVAGEVLVDVHAGVLELVERAFAQEELLRGRGVDGQTSDDGGIIRDIIARDDASKSDGSKGEERDGEAHVE
jgi:hypothetical protein